MLNNIDDHISSQQVLKTQAEQFKRHTNYDLTYEQYSEILILDVTTHYKKFKWDLNFSS